MSQPEAGADHQCDADCRCPVHGNPLLYSPAGDVHACQDPGCDLARGARRTLIPDLSGTECTVMDDFPAPPARPGGDTLRAAGQWLASVKGRPGTAVGQTGWIPNVPTPEPTRDMGDLVRHGAQLRLALDLIEFEAADELRPYDENLHTIARRLLDTIEQLTGTPLAAIEAVGGHVVRKER